VSVQRFTQALQSALGRVQGSAVRDQERYLGSLHLEDLALAVACSDGNEAAWEYFVREHRPVLYRAADAIDSSGGVREIADSLYGELFGLVEREGQRRSLFRYFHGRSSMATWLRAILSQRYVDRLRQTRRLDPLPEETDSAGLATADDAVAPERERFVTMMKPAIVGAIQRLAPRDRLRLACYYAQDLTLAEIGRTLGEHEATCSRHLARTRRAIREDVERQLRQEGMTDTELDECFASVVEDAGPLNLAELFSAGRKNPVVDRST
jgi:RNA polymerase sigma-70 factor (ECF subfamily)